LEQIKTNLINRDQQDIHRVIAPLTKAPDAVEINTDNRSFEENVEEVIRHFRLKEALCSK
jgi:cytidylate kinase